MASNRLPPVAEALKSSIVRFAFAIYLLILVYVALDQGFRLAAIGFVAFAAGSALIGVRKFKSKLEHQRYVESV